MAKRFTDERCCAARAAPRSRCRCWRSCSTATASRTRRRLTIPKRYVVCFGGQSLGGDGDPLHNDYVPEHGRRATTTSSPRSRRWRRCRRDVSVVSGLLHPDRERRHRPGGRPARRLPRLVAVPAAVGRPLADEHRVGRADLRSDRRRRHRRQHAVQVAGLPGPGRSGTCRVSAPYGRDMISYKANPSGGDAAGHPAGGQPARWRSTPCSTTSRRPTTPAAAAAPGLPAAQPQERARPGRRQICRS